MNKSTFYFLPTGQEIYFKKNGVITTSFVDKTTVIINKSDNSHDILFNINDNNELYLINEIFKSLDNIHNNISFNDLALNQFEQVCIFNRKLNTLVLFKLEEFSAPIQGIITEKKIKFQRSFVTVTYTIESIIPCFENGEKKYNKYYDISESNIIYGDKN